MSNLYQATSSVKMQKNTLSIPAKNNKLTNPNSRNE